MTIFFLRDPKTKSPISSRRPSKSLSESFSDHSDTSAKISPKTSRSSSASSSPERHSKSGAKSTSKHSSKHSPKLTLNPSRKSSHERTPRSSSPKRLEMSSPTKNAIPTEGPGAPGSFGKTGGLPMPGLSGSPNGPVGNLLKGPVDANGKLKDAALMVGIKLDLEAEVHLTARVRGDILIGLY